jgi:hypothetical protein
MEKFVRTGHENVRFFIGPEIEKTPAADKRTLFVVGLQDTNIVEGLAREYKTPHIFLSANRSFDSVEEVEPGVYMVGKTMVSDWEKQIHYLLDKGFMVSLDYPAHKHALVLKALNPGIWQSRNFVPILSVAIPNVNTSSVNLTIKIDDSNFKATNDGVWCMNHHEITDSNRFTSWNEYRDDVILTDDEIGKHYVSGAVPNPVLKVSIPDDVMTKLRVPEPVYADINKPALNMEAVKNIVEAGLDPDAPSKLKPENEEEKSPTIVAITNPVDAAEAYAEGATTDPLAAKEPEKKAKAKK